MNLIRYIPNALTAFNLLIGCVAITLAYKGQLFTASLLVFICALFDFADGLTARLLKAYSPVGKQLDSLADMVSFGVLPAVIMFHLFERTETEFNPAFLVYFPFLIAVCSALRLAIFNIDARQSEQFIGLPTPAMAILIASFPLILWEYSWSAGILANPYFLATSILVVSMLMVSKIPLFSLKVRSFKWKTSKYAYILLISSIILLVLIKFAAIPIIIFLYIALSLIRNLTKK